MDQDGYDCGQGLKSVHFSVHGLTGVNDEGKDGCWVTHFTRR